jgi:hypothetical protein
MTKPELIPLTSYSEIPPDMTEAEAREFWDTHAITEEFLATAPPVSEDDLPPVRPETPRSRPQLPSPLMRRLKQLAWQRRMSVDILIQEIIEQGLAAEEERQRATGRRSG